MTSIINGCGYLSLYVFVLRRRTGKKIIPFARNSDIVVTFIHPTIFANPHISWNVSLSGVTVAQKYNFKNFIFQGFKRKEFRGKLAIAITANFANRRTTAEAVVEEISGVAFVYKQDFFNNLYEELGIALENIVYYKDETHYFVMTTKKHSLLDRGVLKKVRF